MKEGGSLKPNNTHMPSEVYKQSPKVRYPSFQPLTGTIEVPGASYDCIERGDTSKKD